MKYCDPRTELETGKVSYREAPLLEICLLPCCVATLFPLCIKPSFSFALFLEIAISLWWEFGEEIFFHGQFRFST